MKKYLFIYLTLAFSVCLNAQTLYLPDAVGLSSKSGKIGIGISSPCSKLEISDIGSSINALTLSSNDAINNTISLTFHSRKGYLTNPTASIRSFLNKGLNNEEDGSLEFYTARMGVLQQRMIISYDGKIGIGTSSPSSKLEISDNGSDINALRLSSNDAINNIISLTFHSRKGYLTNPTASIRSYLDKGLNNEEDGSLEFYTTQGGVLQQRMRINYNGNIGIGVAPSDAKLDVEGTIRAHEVKVCLTQGCDFVFKEDYKLRSIDELDKFIQVNNHLPEIAPAKEMETNGINLSEMNAKLLQKIEEQTLYIIEMNKQLQELKRQVADIKK